MDAKSEADIGGGSSEHRRIAVWDLPTRLFHWILAILFLALWITGTDGPLDWHMWIGEALLALLLFRLVWGFLGSRHSRFADFVVGPRAALDHLREVAHIARYGTAGGHGDHSAGHTRLGGWMILMLLALLLAQCISGLFASDEIATDGPLNHMVSGSAARMLTVYHSLAFDVLVALIAVHIAAALFYLARKRENLILPLITGRADLPPEAAAREGRFASIWLALLLAVVAAAIVWGVTTL